MSLLKFYPIDVTYKIIDDKPVVMLFGKALGGHRVCVVDEDFEPYLYVIPRNKEVADKISKIQVDDKGTPVQVVRVENVNKKYLGKVVNVLKVFTKLPKHLLIIRDVIKDWDIIELITEYDIVFVRRYLIDKNIIPFTLTDVECEKVDMGFKVSTFKIKEIKQDSDEIFETPKILAIDIETYNPNGKGIAPDVNPVLMISFYGEDFKKVITWKKFKTELDYVEFVDGEVDLIDKFKEIIEKYKPDVVCGYYSDGFDFPYIQTRAKKYKIKLDLGLDGSELKCFKRGRFETAKLVGIAHIDVFKFIKRILRVNLDTSMFGLNDVAYELLGEKKIDVELDNLAKIWDDEPEKLSKFCEYNLHDSYLTYKLLQKSIANIIELVKIVGLPPYDIIRMGFSQLVEWYLLRQAPSYGEIAPEQPHSDEIRRRRSLTFKGGFVFEPKPGLYKNIVVYDFRSLYPSIISSHNISPATLNSEGKGEQVPLKDEYYWFSNEEKAFIPTLIEDIVKRRMRIKEIMKEGNNALLEARSQSLKILANSFYGYLGFYAARWYSMECARSTTAYGRFYVNKVIEGAKEQGFNVLYADTDSCFMSLEGKTKQDAEKFADEINEGLPGVMELEYEGHYPAGIFVSAKAGTNGAKKKYALLTEKGDLKLRGFEAVRRNSSQIAKEVQGKVLNIVLKEDDKEKAMKYVRSVLEDLRKKRVDNSKMIIHTQLTKDTSDYYSIGPHVAVASRMKALGLEVGPGTIIHYIVTSGGGIIRDRSKLPEEVKQGNYDADYYINNQVVPAIEKIFEVLGYTREDIAEKEGQKKLGEF